MITRVSPILELIAHTPNPEQTIALAAKLCYSAEGITDIKENIESKDISKYVAMLLRLNHLSPFEHAAFTFSMEGVSRALLAQITRHRIASFSVKSQRYVGVENGLNYILPPSIEKLGREAVEKFVNQMQTMHDWYIEWQSLLGKGEKSNEDARFVLPNAAETKMIVTMNARELMHFFELRCCNRAQWEIREIAWMMLEAVLKVAPNVFARSGPSCLNGVCSEGKMTCGKMQEVKERREVLSK